MPRPFTPEEGATVALLQRAGLSRVAAHCLACLVRGDAWASEDVVAASGLTQPEVSQGMKELVARGGAIQEKAPRKGPGRPRLRHTLAENGVRAVLASRRADLEEELAVLDEVAARLGQLRGLGPR